LPGEYFKQLNHFPFARPTDDVNHRKVGEEKNMGAFVGRM
jgi:hypothetical protein